MDRETLEKHCLRQIGASFSEGIQHLGAGRVCPWVLRPGMEFQSPHIWWGDTSKSRQAAYGGGPHEGVDFALGVDTKSGRVRADMEGLPVPAFVDGTPRWCFADLVGETVIVPTVATWEDFRLVIQYSHIDFHANLLGQAIETGTVLGNIKRSDNPKSATASHLHISTALLRVHLLQRPPNAVKFKDWLEWEMRRDLVFINPLALVGEAVKSRFLRLGASSLSPLHAMLCSGEEKADRLHARRVLARHFPGVQVLTMPSAEAGRDALDHRGALVLCADDAWAIELGSSLASPPSLRLAGEGDSTLINALQELEFFN